MNHKWIWLILFVLSGGLIALIWYENVLVTYRQHRATKQLFKYYNHQQSRGA